MKLLKMYIVRYIYQHIICNIDYIAFSIVKLY